MARIGRKSTLEWIKEDYKSNPIRFCCELIGMISNLIASHRWIWLKGMYCWRFLVKTFNSYTNKSIKSTLLARSTAVDVFGKNAIIVV